MCPDQTEPNILIYIEQSSVTKDHHTRPINTLQDGSNQTSTLFLIKINEKYPVQLSEGRHFLRLL